VKKHVVVTGGFPVILHQMPMW